MDFTVQVCPENPIRSSKEVSFTFESSDFRGSNVITSVTYMAAPDKKGFGCLPLNDQLVFLLSDI